MRHCLVSCWARLGLGLILRTGALSFQRAGHAQEGEGVAGDLPGVPNLALIGRTKVKRFQALSADLMSFERSATGVDVGHDQSAAAQEPDGVAFLFAVIGGVSMGTNPVPIKAPSVIKAGVHPVIFMFYKVVWVFLTSWIFVIVNLLRGQAHPFEFSWLGVLSAATWIPGGLCCIWSVPRIGVGIALTLVTGCNTILTFFLFWLVFGESMKLHHWSHGVGLNKGYYLAPAYLFCVLLGMASLIAASSLGQGAGAGDAPEHEADNGEGKARAVIGKNEARHGQKAGRESTTGTDMMSFRLGLAAAAGAGCLGAVQNGLVNAGRTWAREAAGCNDRPEACPAVLKERFNTFGSWTASFGTGAFCISLMTVVGLWGYQFFQGKQLSSLHVRTMMFPGNAAGILWTIGNFFILASVVRGGSSVMMPASAAISLVTSGLWGLFYYREVTSPVRSILWSVAAIWTVAMIVLLSQEKVKA